VLLKITSEPNPPAPLTTPLRHPIRNRQHQHDAGDLKDHAEEEGRIERTGQGRSGEPVCGHLGKLRARRHGRDEHDDGNAEG
jgi:hypothetical protein